MRVSSRFMPFLAVALMAQVSVAHGASGPVVLGFGASYQASDGSSRTHHGVDIAMDVGEAVEAPRSGRVRFAGRIPAADGGSVLAVSLEAEEGVVTLMPLQDLDVRQGQSVQAGTTIGHLAAGGDPSSQRPHLHVGLKRGSLYLDPAGLISRVPAPSQEAPVPIGEPVVQTDPASAPSPEAMMPRQSAPANIAAPVSTAITGSEVRDTRATQGSGLTGLEARPAAQSGAASPEGSARSGVAAGAAVVARETRGESLAPGVTLVGSTSVRNEELPSASRIAEPSPSALPARSRGSVSTVQSSSPVGRSRGGLAILLTAFCGGCLLASRRVFVHRVTAKASVSDRFGIVLQHLKTGDTLRGLTSCSGPLPSQSRGH